MRIGRYRFGLLDEPAWCFWWECTDAVRGAAAFTPWGAWMRLQRYHRAEPRGHWPGCDGAHHRGDLCPQALLPAGETARWRPGDERG